MTQTIKHIYYYNMDLVDLEISDEKLKGILDSFKTNYLSELGDSVIVVPSVHKEGLETLPQFN